MLKARMNSPVMVFGDAMKAMQALSKASAQGGVPPTTGLLVVLRASHKGQVSEQDIIDWCRENMAVYKIPRSVRFVDALPKSGSGKVMWRLLQEDENKA